MEKNIGKYVIMVGFLVMLIQHFCLIIIPFILPEMTIDTFYVDILGLLIAGIGYILLFTAIEERRYFYLSAGICFILWVLCTFIWRIITKFYDITLNTSNTNSTLDKFLEQVITERLLFSFFFIFASLFLFIASIMVYKAHGGTGSVLLTTYSLINLIGTILIGAPIYLLPESQVSNATNLALGVVFGLILKIILDPII